MFAKSLTAAAVLGAAACAYAQEAEKSEADERAAREEALLKEEVAYVEALVDCGFSDFAETVIAETKKRWPESEARFFALEVRSLLSLGKEAEANEKIAALPDRNSEKYWAARLEVANFCWQRGRKKDCEKIYAEFFKKNAKPSAAIKDFVRLARWQYGQILFSGGRLAEAAANYTELLNMLDRRRNDEDANIWNNVACETTEIHLQLAEDSKDAKARDAHLKAAAGFVRQLLWEHDKPVYFGRAIAMRAKIELLKGSVQKAQDTIEEYMDQLTEIHKKMEEADPDGRLGLLRQSPMPLCRFMHAQMLWKAAQAEAKKPKRNDERIKDLMFGAKGRNNRRGKGGAYPTAINVFIRYPQSAWAARAGEMAKEMEKFAKAEYGAKIKTKITPEQELRVRAYQFRGATESFGEGRWEDAIKQFGEALAQYPDDGKDCVSAAEHIVMAKLRLWARAKEEKKSGKASADIDRKIESLRIDADAIEGYIAERFSGSAERMTATEGGNATLRLAGLEKQLGEPQRSGALYRMFLEYYPFHANAPAVAASLASAATEEKRLRDAIALWTIIEERYPDSIYYAAAMTTKARCQENAGDRAGAIATVKKYVESEKNPLDAMKGRMMLANLYQKDGRDALETASTNATPEACEKQMKEGTTQIVRGIKQFSGFAAQAEKMIGDEGVSEAERKEYAELHEAAMYLVADNWGRLTKPEKNLPEYRKRCIAALDAYTAKYPKGKYAKSAYVKLSMVWTLMNDLSKSKEALENLRKQFPDSEEAKKSMPRLARSLVEYSKTVAEGPDKDKVLRDVTQIYSEMIRQGGGMYQAPDYVRAGENLIEARNWDLADEAFEKAIASAGTNQTTSVARARIGKARSLYAQRHYGEARAALDAFMEDPKTSRSTVATNACELIVEIALIQGRDARDDNERMRHYGAALAAAKKLKGYWSKEPLWKQDRAAFLMPADVKIAQAEAESAMGLDEAAAKTRRVAAANLQSYLQTRAADGEQINPDDRSNVEEAYSKYVPLLAKLGPDQAERALEAGARYLQLFPEGEYVDVVRRAMNEAKAQSGAQADAPAAEEKPSAAAAEEKPADGAGAPVPAAGDGAEKKE